MIDAGVEAIIVKVAAQGTFLLSFPRRRNVAKP
jgi:hypothetical protein